MLSSEDIVRGIQKARKIAPLHIDEQTLDQYVDLIRRQKIVANKASKEFEQLKHHMSESALFLTDEAKHSLNDIAIYVLPLPMCIAYSEITPNNQPIIVISTGFINIVAANILFAQVGSLLPKQFDDFYSIQLRTDMSVNGIFTNSIFLMLVHHFRFAEPLPNLANMLNEQQMEDAKTAINGAITFILLHELAHIKLGHLDNTAENQLISQQFVIDEQSDVYKNQEIEADAYALECIKDEAKVIGTFWQQQAMSFFVSLELVSGLKLSDEHPMAINRNFLSDNKRANWGKELDVEPRPAFYHSVAQQFKQTADASQGEINPLLQTSYRTCWANILYLKDIYQPYGLDLSLLYRSPSRCWLDI